MPEPERLAGLVAPGAPAVWAAGAVVVDDSSVGACVAAYGAPPLYWPDVSPPDGSPELPAALGALVAVVDGAVVAVARGLGFGLGAEASPLPEEPVPDDPVAGPVPDDPVPEDPVLDDPGLEEPLCDESGPDAPVPDEPLGEESAPEDPVRDAPVPPDPVPDEPVPEEPPSDEPALDEPAPDEPPEGPDRDEPAPDEPVPEDRLPDPSEPDEPVPEESVPAVVLVDFRPFLSFLVAALPDWLSEDAVVTFAPPHGAADPGS